MSNEMDRDFDTQDLEAQADSILAAAGDFEEIPVALEKIPFKSRKAADAEKKNTAAGGISHRVASRRRYLDGVRKAAYAFDAGESLRQAGRVGSDRTAQ